jgi:hypothetical protein
MNYIQRIHDLLVEAVIQEEVNRQGIMYKLGQKTGPGKGRVKTLLSKLGGESFRAGRSEYGQGTPKKGKKEHPLVKATKGMSPTTTGLGGGARPIG